MKRYAFPLSLAAAFLLAAFAVFAPSQTAPTTPAGPNTPSVVYVSTDPTGSCTMNNLQGGNAAPVFITLNVNTGVISRCKAGTWANDISAGGNSFTAAPTPSTAAGVGLGTAALPWANLIMGTAATNVATITPASMSAARAITLADPGGAATIAYTNSTTAQPMSGLGALTPLTAGSPALGSAALPWASVIFGTAATNNVTLTSSTQAAARTINVPDYGLATQQFPGTVFLTGSAYTNATTGFTSVTGLAFPVAASTNYTAHCNIVWQGSAGTTGPKYQFTGPGSPTAVGLGMHSTVTATTFITAAAVAFSSPVANSGTVTTATNFEDQLDLMVLNGTNAGTVQLQAAANGAGTLTIQPGSSCQVQ